MAISLKDINIVRQCKTEELGLWECPPFLFVVMGIVNIISIIVTYQVATRASNEPEYAALAALAVAAIIFVIGSAVVLGFNKVVEANQMKSEFIGIISHQLRSPLAIFKWTLNALREDLQKERVANEVSEAIGTLNETNQRMIHLVSMLLEVNRIESHRLQLKKSPLSLEEMTQRILDSQKNFSHSLGISLSFRPSADPRINADNDKLQMVLQNLIDNAIRYSRKGGRVAITIEKEKASVIWKVSDTGIGIPAADQKNMFSKFFRAQNARIYQSEGNGIGLYIAKRIIEEHGGIMDFSSKENAGTEFWFSLPISDQSSV